MKSQCTLQAKCASYSIFPVVFMKIMKEVWRYCYE